MGAARRRRRVLEHFGLADAGRERFGAMSAVATARAPRFARSRSRPPRAAATAPPGRDRRRRRRPGSPTATPWRSRSAASTPTSPERQLEDGNWEVGYFADDDEVALVIVDATTGLVRESWTGYQVAWKMARGYSGSFGHKLNAPYVFLPLCALFLLGLVDWRRPWRTANLDLLVLLAFGVSHFFFNRAEIGVSVPLAYPPLLYLLGRGAVARVPRARRGLRPVWPATWLLIAALFLVGFRVGLNVADSGAIDVGYAGVVGADRIADGEQLYGNFPDDVSQGDTYGPVNYYAYVPFEQDLPLERQLGRPARPPTPRRSSSTSPPSPCFSCSASASGPDRQAASWRRPSPSPGPPTPTPPTPSNRTPTTPWWPYCWSRRSWYSQDRSRGAHRWHSRR